MQRMVESLLLWQWLFERAVPDGFDVLGIMLAIIGVIVIFYMPRKRKSIWSRQQ